MKLRLGILMTLCSIVTWTFAGLWLGWIYPKNYKYALNLADDASLPETKAKYLREYLEKVKEIKRNPAYFFMTPDMELDKQRSILEGLIKRFDDIAKIKPSEMAYQQGMEQLTGQEIDHQLNGISGLFCSAKMRENFLVFFLIGWASWIFPLLAILFFWLFWLRATKDW